MAHWPLVTWGPGSGEGSAWWKHWVKWVILAHLFQCSSPASSFDSTNLFPIIFRQEIWEGSIGLQSYPVLHEVGSHVCKGIFGNRIVEALNSDLPTVMFYCQGSQGKPGIPSPCLQFKLNCWLCPQPFYYSWPVTWFLRFLEGAMRSSPSPICSPSWYSGGNSQEDSS